MYDSAWPAEMSRGNCPFTAGNVMFNVSGSATAVCQVLSRLLFVHGTAFASVFWIVMQRSQLNFTAPASNVVPSENLTFGLIFSAHVLPSFVVIDSATSGTMP